MKKILFFILLPVLLFSGTVTITGGKWSAAGITTGDDIIIDGTVGPDTFDNTFSVNSVYRPSTNTQTAAKTNGKKLTITGAAGLVDSGMTGAKVYPDSIVFTANNARMVNHAAGGAITSTSTILIFNGNMDTLINNKIAYLKKLEIGANDTLIGAGSTGFTIDNTVAHCMKMGENAHFSKNKNITLTAEYTGKFISQTGTATFSGNGRLSFISPYATLKDTLPAFIDGGTGSSGCSFYCSPISGNGSYYFFSGNIMHTDSTNVQTAWYAGGASTVTTINTSGYNLVTGALDWGTNSASGTRGITLQLNGSTISAYDVNQNIGLNYNSIIDSFGNCTFICRRNFELPSQHVVSGAWTLYKKNGTAGKTVLNGKRIWDLVINKTSGIKDSIPAAAGCDTVNNLTLTSGISVFNKNIYIAGNYTNNLTNAADTAKWKATKYIAGNFVRGLGSHSLVDSPTVFVGSSESDITSSGTSLKWIILRKTAQALLKLMDNAVFGFFTLDSGTINVSYNLTDTNHILSGSGKDSVYYNDTVTVYKTDSIGVLSKLSGGTGALKLWTGSIDTTKIYSNTHYRCKSQINKSSGLVFFFDIQRPTVLEIVDGGAVFADSCRIRDSLRVTGTDSISFLKGILLTRNNSLLSFAAGTKPGFAANDTIWCDSCGAVVTNLSGHTIPPIRYPTTGPISYTPAASYTVGVPITPVSMVQGGCLADSVIKISGPSWLTVNRTTGQWSGTPDAAGTVYVVTRAYNNAGTSTSSATDTVVVIASSSRKPIRGFNIGIKLR